MIETEKPVKDVEVVECPGLSRVAKAQADFNFVADDLLVLPKGVKLVKEPVSSVVEVEYMLEPSLVLRRHDVHIEEIKDMKIKNIMESLGLISADKLEVATEDGVVHEVPVVGGELGQEPIYVIRHVRPTEWVFTHDPDELDTEVGLLGVMADEILEKQLLPTGGVTMVFKIEPWNKQFKVAFAICHENDLFNKKASVRIARSRLAGSNYFTVEGYNPEFSLVTNLYAAIARYLKAPGFEEFSAELKADPHFIYVPVSASGEGRHLSALKKVFTLVGKEYVPSE